MPHRRLHLTGASGAGVTTLGRVLAGHFALPHHDTDDYFWLPTDPPYSVKRPVEDRLRLMQEMFLPRPGWVLSGSIGSWADPIVPLFDAVIFVATPQAVRLERLARREAMRLGPQDRQSAEQRAATATFLTWAAGYDDPTFDGRNRARHEAWLATLLCPVLHVDGMAAADDVAGTIEAWLADVASVPKAM